MYTVPYKFAGLREGGQASVAKCLQYLKLFFKGMGVLEKERHVYKEPQITCSSREHVFLAAPPFVESILNILEVSQGAWQSLSLNNVRNAIVCWTPLSSC